MSEGKEKNLAHVSGGPPPLSLKRAARDPGRVVLRRAMSPAWPAGQGCSAAVAPARPLRGPGGVFSKKTEKDAANRGVPQPLEGAFPWN